MLKETMAVALNEQIKWELYSGYLYLAMAAYFSDMGLPGFAHWMRFQAHEELLHAMKFYDFVEERRSRVALQAIDAPPSSWSSPQAVFAEALAHEQLVTQRINNLVDLSIAEKDHATNTFLQWFVSEQVEEEASVDEVLNKLRLVGDGGGLYMLDKELAGRLPPQVVAQQ